MSFSRRVHRMGRRSGIPLDTHRLSGACDIGVSAAGALTDFEPTDIAGLKLWLRADLGVTLNGATVSDWADQSGNGYHLTQAAAPSQPTFVASDAGANNQAAIDFDGINDVLARAAGFAPLDGATAYTIFIVSRCDTPAAYTCLIDDRGAGTSTNFRVEQLNNRYSYVNDAATAGYAALASTVPICVHTVFDGSLVGDANRLKQYHNNVQQGLTFTNVIPAACIATTRYQIGDVIGGGLPWDGRVYEVALYTGAKTLAEQAAFTGYEIARYAL